MWFLGDTKHENDFLHLLLRDPGLMKLETYMQKQSKNLDLLRLPFMENTDILNGQWEIAFNSLTLQE